MESNNIPALAKVLAGAWPTDGKRRNQLLGLAESPKDWSKVSPADKANVAFELLAWIESEDMGKGLFAQLLADALQDKTVTLTVPQYIKDAIQWVCEVH
ncbi:hypothetical protein RB24_24970 [Herbaspirillum rubrisubalbicans]|uniref:Uncharacterized protein n=2 Tax=Herbaspirillum rubrisubalbicans TaxID=80842 RepID=A0ABX9BV31_9BURK|nr:hypothetical protein RB24_24970 [Herbaspirillum rubrisubalbicans]